jgi:hypothetical protein
MINKIRSVMHKAYWTKQIRTPIGDGTYMIATCSVLRNGRYVEIPLWEMNILERKEKKKDKIKKLF